MTKLIFSACILFLIGCNSSENQNSTANSDSSANQKMISIPIPSEMKITTEKGKTMLDAYMTDDVVKEQNQTFKIKAGYLKSILSGLDDKTDIEIGLGAYNTDDYNRRRSVDPNLERDNFINRMAILVYPGKGDEIYDCATPLCPPPSSCGIPLTNQSKVVDSTVKK